VKSGLTCILIPWKKESLKGRKGRICLTRKLNKSKKRKYFEKEAED
jgi:hypothetical protein